jgi:hypothetical protein
MSNKQTTLSKIRETAADYAADFEAFKRLMEAQADCVKGLIGEDDGRARWLKILENDFDVDRFSRIGTFYNALCGGEDFPGWVNCYLEKVNPDYRKDFKDIIPEAFSEALKLWVTELCRILPQGMKRKKDITGKKPPLPVKFGQYFSAVLKTCVEEFGWADSEAASGEHIESEKWDI